jgi:hypothetical protein
MRRLWRAAVIREDRQPALTVYSGAASGAAFLPPKGALTASAKSHLIPSTTWAFGV